MITNLLLPHFTKPGAYIKKLDLASCLREASRKGHLEIVKMLLENEANPLDRDKEGKTALHYAAEGNVEQQALDIFHQLVLDEYKQVNNVELAKACDKHGRNVLHFAASCGHRRLCEWVFSQDIIDVDGKDRDGRSALYYAVGGKHDDAQLLDVWRRRRSSRQAINMFDLKDFKNTTPLHLAAEKGNLKMVENILSKVKQRDRETVVRAPDVLGLTALHKAASGGHALVVGKLLSEGAHPLTERDCDGKTALHYAVQAENVVDAREVATLLLKSCHSQKVKFLLLNAFAFGTGFAEESDGCNSSLEKYLLEEKHKIWRTGETGNLLKVADILNDEQMVKELLSKGINIEQIRSYEFREPRHKQNVQKVQDQMDTINNLFEEDTDKPALQDNLGRSAFVNGLASLFLNPSVSSPITVGISGEWGMGKSSVMLQVESILLKTAAHLAVSSSLRKEDIPGTSNSKSFGCGEAKCGNIIGIVENFVKRLFYTVKNLMKVLCGRNEINIGKSHIKILRNILSTYQRDSHQVFKSLAVAKRRNMIPIGRTKEEQVSIRDDKIPSILTVRYNAWQYRSQTEAWAGLGVEIIKELEAAMTVAQRLSSSWRYNWASRKRTLCVEVFLPCFLAVIVAVWVTVIIWFLLDRVKDHSKDFKFASLPITLIAVSWAAVKSVMSVVKPVSSTVVDYLCFPDHSQKLGYHQKVIDDINFLKKELGHRPSRIWSFYAFIWCWTPFCSWETYVPKTTIPKMIPASQENLRMVVFVDDLDRCHENVILEILSAINLVLSVCEINVVMAMDKTLIEKAIERKFGNRQNKSDKSGPDLADKYLRKLIQLPLDLPDPSPSDYNIFLQRQLGVLAMKKAATHSEEVTGKFSSKARKATFNSRNSGLGKATASLEETGVRKRRYHTSGRDDMAGELEEITEVSVRGERQIPGGESTNITIPDNELPTKRIEEDNGGGKSWVHTCFNKLTSFLVCNPHEEIDNEQEWMKFFSATISTTIDFEILKRKYSPAERDAFCFLHIQVTGSRRLPREWKRLKNYHRLVWNILYKSTQVKTLRGWQVQLIAWVFICWQWKNQINTLIQSWHELSVFQEDDPWLRDIVEHYIDERWPPPPLKIDGLAHGDVKNTINRRVNKSVESENSETMSKEEDTRRKNYLPVVRRVLEKKKQLKDQALEDRSSPEELEDRSTPEEEELIDLVDTVHQVLQQANNRLKGKNNESTGKCEEVGEGEVSLEQARMIKDKDEQNPKASQKNTGKAKVAKVDKEEEEHKEWINLRETLKRYDVSIKSILVFQGILSLLLCSKESRMAASQVSRK